MNKDLTTGKPASVLLRFTLPMLLSVAFQQLYNIADSVIAGKFAGEDALAAVGASYPVTMIFMAVAFGMNIGISVVISQLFGAKDFKEMKTAAYTGFISVAVLGVVLTVVGTVLCEPILRMLGTPENIMEDTLPFTFGGFCSFLSTTFLPACSRRSATAKRRCGF